MTSAMESPDPGGAAPVPDGSGAESADSAARAGELLDSVESRPLAEHPDAYEQVHQHLSEALSAIDDV